MNTEQTVPISLLEARKWALAELKRAGKNQTEASDNVDFLLSGALDMNYGMLRANLTRTMPPLLAERWPQWIAGLMKDIPPQYLLGTAPFYGREFRVDQRVLIPRPETEQLVEWILADISAVQGNMQVIDIGTGSGAIIETLMLENQHIKGTAADISSDALAVAHINAKRFKLPSLTFIQSDVWQNIITDQQFDVIVSNPPYIDRADQDEVDTSVKQYEPDLALYAEQAGLAIYQKIADGLTQHLAPQGRAYFEIGYQQGPDLMEIFQMAMPKATVTLKQDFAGLNRMIRVENHGN